MPHLQYGQNFTTVSTETCLLQELATCQTKECVQAPHHDRKIVHKGGGHRRSHRPFGHKKL